MMADEWHEMDWCHLLVLQRSADPPVHEQSLLLPCSDGNQHASTFRDLRQQRFRNGWRARTDEYRVVRRVLAPAERTVAEEHRDVVDSGTLNRLARLLVQCGNALDREYLFDEMGEQHGLIGRPRADLENSLTTRERE